MELNLRHGLGATERRCGAPDRIEAAIAERRAELSDPGVHVAIAEALLEASRFAVVATM